MKSLFIIGAHANSVEKQRILSDCIDAVKLTGFDIMVASHTALPEYIVKKVNYYIYDSDNRFNNADRVHYWSKIDNITIKTWAKVAYDYPFIRNIRNALSLASAHEYQFFYWTDFDNIFSEEDINKLQELKNQIIQNNKNFIFFKPQNAVWEIGCVTMYDVYYETFLFGGKTEHFIQKFDKYFPKSLKEYNEKFGTLIEGRPACAEHYIYAAFEEEKDSSIIIDSFVKDYFKSSNINQSSSNSHSGIKCIILPANNGKHYLFIANYNLLKYLYTVYINNTKLHEFVLFDDPDNHLRNAFRLVELEKDCKISVEIHSGSTLVQVYNLHYTVDNLNEYQKDGSIIID